MVKLLHQLSAAFYLATAIAMALGLALPDARLARLSVWALGAAALTHAAALAGLHALDPPPALTALPGAVSLMALLAVGFVLVLLLRRGRLESLAGLVAPFAFAATLYAGASLAGAEPTPAESGGWPHLHVILASAGLSLLGVAGVAGVLFLAGNRQLKRKRAGPLRRPLPSLEALDRINVVALALGFPLLTFGMLAGMIWSHALTGRLWDGDAHATWTGIGWAIYLALVVARFGLGWRGREAAGCAVAGFVFLLFAVVGVETLR